MLYVSGSQLECAFKSRWIIFKMLVPRPPSLPPSQWSEGREVQEYALLSSTPGNSLTGGLWPPLAEHCHSHKGMQCKLRACQCLLYVRPR